MFLVGGFGSKKILEKKISNDEVDDLKIVEVLENKELSDEVSAEKQVQDEIVIDSSTSEIKAEEVKTENVEETKRLQIVLKIILQILIIKVNQLAIQYLNKIKHNLLKITNQ